MYDAQLGRFHVQDRFAEKHFDFTPYQYGGNNPIKFIDVNGDSLVINGGQSAINKFVNTVDNGLGGFYNANVNADGLFTLQPTDMVGPMSPSQVAFHNTLMETADLSTNTVEISVVESSENVIVGSYVLGAIDIDDVNAFGNGPVVSSSAKIGHEVAEQTAKQRDGASYKSAHNGPAISAENAISGSRRIDVNGVAPSSKTVQKNGKISGTIDIRYNRNEEIRTVTYYLSNGNITRVDQ